MSLALILLAFLALALFYLLLRPQHHRIPEGAKLPDGPAGRPLVGNLTDIPPFHSWLKFHSWSKTYGPLFRLNLAGQNHIIVSDEGIANDLLRDRGTIYSSRAHQPMASELLSHGLRPLLLPYGENWRSVRKLMHSLTNLQIAAKYAQVQEEESVRCVRDLLREPEGYENWFERFSAGLILRLAYSKPVVTGRESYVRRILAVDHALERVASPGAYLVDTFPVLMYLPSWLAPFKREAERLHGEEIDLFRTLLREGVESGEENFCTRWAENRASYELSEDQVAHAIGTLFEAGAGTTAASMMSFVLAMTLHPNELRKVQEEVDAVVGADRLPMLEDMPNLPRVRAVVKEVLRWRPVSAGGLPHMLTKDDTYDLPTTTTNNKTSDKTTLFLPANSIIHPVQWSIHRSPTLYPDPDSFRPERWLEPSWPTYKDPLTIYPNLQNFSAFGFGRRICPGMHVAERSLYVLVARIAWAADIGPRRGGEGRKRWPPSYDYGAGFNVSFSVLWGRRDGMVGRF